MGGHGPSSPRQRGGGAAAGPAFLHYTVIIYQHRLMTQPCSLFQPIAKQPCASLGSSLGASYLQYILSVLFVNKLYKKLYSSGRVYSIYFIPVYLYIYVLYSSVRVYIFYFGFPKGQTRWSVGPLCTTTLFNEPAARAIATRSHPELGILYSDFNTVNSYPLRTVCHNKR
jgi:hypothetical protein